MDTRSLRLVVCFLVAVCNFSTAAGQTTWIKELKSRKDFSIVVYGTSLTSGAASTVWVDGLRDSLQARYGAQVTMKNMGREAMHSDWGVSQLQERVISHNPDVVFIEFAINDAYLPYHISVEASELNLKYMIARLRAHNPRIQIVVQIMNDPIREHAEQRPSFDSYYEKYKKTARKMGVKLIDHRTYWREMVKDEKLYKKWVPDGIHPTEYASRELILPYILKCLTD